MRTRLRKLRVDDRSFTWRAEIGHLQGEHDCHRCIRLRIWCDGKNSRPLQVDLLSTAWSSPCGACATDDSYPTSADVRAVIVYGLDNGWKPAVAGGTFLLTEVEHATAFELPGFLITDRRREPGAPDPSGRVIAAYLRREESPDPPGESL